MPNTKPLPKPEQRKKREADALRENLLKRKQQQRRRQSQKSEEEI